MHTQADRYSSVESIEKGGESDEKLTVTTKTRSRLYLR